MLVLTRKQHEVVFIGEGANEMRVKVLSVSRGGNVRLDVDGEIVIMDTSIGETVECYHSDGIVKVKGISTDEYGQVRLGFDATKKIRIDRSEVRERPGFDPKRERT